MPLNITLTKSASNIPWGFRLNGGKDFGAPITVQKIKPGSIASQSGLLDGDNLSVINDEATQGLKHLEAQDLIKKGGCHLKLVVCRGSEIVMKSSNDELDNSVYNNDSFSNINTSTKTESPYKAETPPFKSPSNITSKNASLYKPSMQNITSGLTKLQKNDENDFPPPPPTSETFAPRKLVAMEAPEVNITTVEGDVDPIKLNPSETLKLVQKIDSGADIPFSPKTGAGVRSSPIQSRLMNIIDKKHGEFEQSQHEESFKSSNKPYSSPKFSQENQRSKSPSNFYRNENTKIDNRSTDAPFEKSSFNHHRPTTESNVPPHPPSNNSRKLIESLDKGAVPVCNVCNIPIRGAYVLAINKIWCQDHFICSNDSCKKALSNTGFVEEGGKLYCKEDYEKYFAPKCEKCAKPIVGNTIKALNKTYHHECFVCQKCMLPISGGVFHLHEGQVYCDKDFSTFFSTKCHGCNFAIEVGDNWIEAAGTNWHGECFNCSVCHTNLQSVGFVHRNGKFLCKNHAKMA